MNRFWKPILHWLRGGYCEPRRCGVFQFQRGAFEHAVWIVQAFYAGNLLWAAWRLADHARYSGYDSLLPLWPLYWAEGMHPMLVGSIVFTLNAVVAAFAAIFPTVGLLRWLAFAGTFMADAFGNSFGKVGHDGHAWVWVMLFLATLPSVPRRGPDCLGSSGTSRIVRQRYLQIFWTAQFAMLLFYSMAGWLKLVSVPIQLVHGEVCALAPEALARHIANRGMQTSSEPILGRFLVEHVALSWPLYLGAMYLEAFSIFVAFRPALHRLWGSGLIFMHLGIGVGMEIWFVPPLFLLALLFVNSPFQHRDTTWRQIIWQLPGMDLLALVLRRGNTSEAAR